MEINNKILVDEYVLHELVQKLMSMLNDTQLQEIEQWLKQNKQNLIQ